MRIGFVGLGWATTAFQLPALRQVPGVEIVGGCDPSADQRRSWERSTKTRAHADLDALLAAERPDAVVIATPPDSHADLCLTAIEAGAHVICEKPFVATVEEADRVLAAAAAAGRQVAVNHEFREKPICRAVKARIDSGAVGELVFCQIWQLMDLAPWEEPVAWRRAMPNRTLFEGGVHLVDLLLHIFGERPSAVYARRSAGLHPHQDADAIHLVTLEFSRNRLAQITIDRLCQAGTRYLELRADCERASLRASEGGRAVVQLGRKRAEQTGFRLDFGPGGLAWEERGLRRRTLARNPREPGRHATAGLMRRVIPCLATGVEPPSSGREARDGLAVIEAAYRSSATGERVEIGYSAQVAPA